MPPGVALPDRDSSEAVVFKGLLLFSTVAMPAYTSTTGGGFLFAHGRRVILSNPIEKVSSYCYLHSICWEPGMTLTTMYKTTNPLT